MGATNIATGDASAKKLYEEQLFRSSVKKTFWLGTSLAGNGGMDSVVYQNRKLDGASGDRVSIDLVPRFDFAPIGEAGTVENNEGTLSHHTFNLTLEEKNVAARYKGKLSAMRPAWDLPSITRERVQERGAEVVDEQMFDALQATATNKVFYAGVATSAATLTATDLITPKKMTQVKTWAGTGGARSQDPIRPVSVGSGRGVYVIGLHDDVFQDLWNDATIQQAYREAQVRGGENPLFKDADLIWNNMVFMKHENFSIFTDGGAGSDVAYSIVYVMGAGAMAWAWGQRPEIVTEVFDYKRQTGVNFNYIAAAGRPSFNSKDYGVTSLVVARTKISDV